MKKYKSGAASFYIVAIATLLFSVIAISFTTLVVTEIRRTSDSDLSQSAYDSALAGVEDAKAAYLSYQSCINQGYTASSPNLSTTTISCSEIVYYMENPDCDTVAHILGRIGKSEKKEVVIEDSTSGQSSMNQAYTCAKITQTLSDYRSTLNSANPSRLVKVDLDSASATSITSIRISWYSDTDGTTYDFTNFNGNVVFPSYSSKLSTPPTISVQLIQTAVDFTLDQFEKTVGSQTNRGTIFLVPTNNIVGAGSLSSTYRPAYSSSAKVNKIPLSSSDINGFLKSNDKTSENLPYVVYCPESSSSEFACSVSIEIPKPIGDGSRSDETFAFVISLPYGGPDTDFAIAFCSNSGVCMDASSGTTTTTATAQAIRGTQIEVDSTGRANDLFRRVSARIDTYDVSYSYPSYAIELLGGGTAIEKEVAPTTEYNFGF